ncbi:MAG: hypothetical protein FWC70_01535 [Defluviitaleaceae bacterium]|nr:hypothetical protein [Defluviitaleaceae bacterium]
MKTWIFALFAAILIAGAGLTVYARSDNVGETIGFIMEMSGDVLHVVGEPLSESGFASVLVSAGNAPIYDLTTGFRVSANALREGIDVRAAYSLRGDEPLSSVVLWLNWSDENAAAFTVTVGENIVTGDDSAVFLCENERYRVAITADTTIIHPRHGRLSPADIVPGMEFFIWTDMITASSPASVYPEKVVVVT